jgi:hypothetical protein
MNAEPFNEFALAVIVAKLSHTRRKGGVSIEIACSMDDPDDLRQYEKVLDFLDEKGIIENLKNEGNVMESDDLVKQDTYLYTPSFTLKFDELNKFLIETSRKPKYSLIMDTKGRLIINDQYLLTKPQLNSPNKYFIDNALLHPGQIITKEHVRKTAGNAIDKKRFHTILEQLQLGSELGRVFFPQVRQDAVQFRNDVTLKALEESKINIKKVEKTLKMLKKISHN